MNLILKDAVNCTSLHFFQHFRYTTKEKMIVVFILESNLKVKKQNFVVTKYQVSRISNEWKILLSNKFKQNIRNPDQQYDIIENSYTFKRNTCIFLSNGNGIVNLRNLCVILSQKLFRWMWKHLILFFGKNNKTKLKHILSQSYVVVIFMFIICVNLSIMSSELVAWTNFLSRSYFTADWGRGTNIFTKFRGLYFRRIIKLNYPIS